MDNALLRYDLLLGLGTNEPLGTSVNLMFAHLEKNVQPVHDDHSPTTFLQTVQPQLGEKTSPVQLDTGVNTSIISECALLWNYSAIVPF